MSQPLLLVSDLSLKRNGRQIRVNRKELETLLARGLDEEEAVDLIIRGMIR